MTWKTVVLGASTGGVEALAEVLGTYPRDCPPTLFVQHISPGFHRSLAERLNRCCAAHVALAKDFGEVREGEVLLAPDPARHLTLTGHGRQYRLVNGPPVAGHRPAADMLFGSAAQLGRSVVGVLLTGMGRDGAVGLFEIRRAGGMTIGQDRESSVVYGMPRVAAEIGAVTRQLPLSEIGPAILMAARDRQEEARHA